MQRLVQNRLLRPATFTHDDALQCARAISRRQALRAIGLMSAGMFAGGVLARFPSVASASPAVALAGRKVIADLVAWFIAESMLGGEAEERIRRSELKVGKSGPSVSAAHRFHNRFATRWRFGRYVLEAVLSDQIEQWLSVDEFLRSNGTSDNGDIPPYKDWNSAELATVAALCRSGKLDRLPYPCNYRADTADTRSKFSAFASRRGIDTDTYAYEYCRPFMARRTRLRGFGLVRLDDPANKVFVLDLDDKPEIIVVNDWLETEPKPARSG